MPSPAPRNRYCLRSHLFEATFHVAMWPLALDLMALDAVELTRYTRHRATMPDLRTR